MQKQQAQQAEMMQAADKASGGEAAAPSSGDHTPLIAGFDENDPSTWGNPGRNDPCPCGSGNKFKHCHGRLA